ncbi:MAG: alpha/beta fold hydrolase [archaeon]
MKRKTVLAAVAGGIGLTGLANARLRDAGELDQPLPGRDRRYDWRGTTVAYVDHGDPTDHDLLFLHGPNAAGTSKEFQAIWDDLSGDFHVIAPDLPGFGRSDRPPLYYSAELYTSFVRDFVADRTENPIVLASSLSGAYAVGAARDRPGHVSRLVLVCPTDDTFPGRKAWVRTLLRSSFVGEALFNLLASRPSIAYSNADHAYYDPSRQPPELDEYQWRAAHQPNARYAPASFVSGYLDPEFDLGEELTALDVPTTLIWGREAETTPLSEGRELAETADARLAVVDYAKLLPHAEHPEEFLEAMDVDGLLATLEE